MAGDAGGAVGSVGRSRPRLSLRLPNASILPVGTSAASWRKLRDDDEREPRRPRCAQLVLLERREHVRIMNKKAVCLCMVVLS